MGSLPPNRSPSRTAPRPPRRFRGGRGALTSWGSSAGGERLSSRVRHEAVERDHGPDELDDAEGPGPGEEAVRTRKDAAGGEGEDEEPMPTLERIHHHHEGERNTNRHDCREPQTMEENTDG